MHMVHEQRWLTLIKINERHHLAFDMLSKGPWQHRRRGTMKRCASRRQGLTPAMRYRRCRQFALRHTRPLPAMRMHAVTRRLAAPCQARQRLSGSALQWRIIDSAINPPMARNSTTKYGLDMIDRPVPTSTSSATRKGTRWFMIGLPAKIGARLCNNRMRLRSYRNVFAHASRPVHGLLQIPSGESYGNSCS